MLLPSMLCMRKIYFVVRVMYHIVHVENVKLVPRLSLVHNRDFFYCSSMWYFLYEINLFLKWKSIDFISK